MRKAALALLVCAACVDVDAYAPLAQLEFAPLQLAVLVPAGANLPNRICDPFTLADVDGDGADDLVYGAEDGSVSVRLRQSPLQFGPEAHGDAVTSGFPSLSLIPVNLDGDGSFEMVAPPLDAWRWDAVAGRPRRLDAFEPPGLLNALSTAGDIDGDGKPEVWFIDSTGLDVRQWDGAHLSRIGHTTDPLDGGATTLLPIDVDDDGGLDLLAFPGDALRSSARVYWHGARPWEHSGLISCGDAIAAMTVADVDGDGLSDLIATDLTHHLVWCRGRGDRSYEAPIVVGQVDGFGSVLAADFDRDRRPDLFAQRGAQADQISVFRNDAGQRFDALELSDRVPILSLPFPRIPRLTLYDLDGDHRIDVVAWAGDGLSWIRNVSR